MIEADSWLVRIGSTHERKVSNFSVKCLSKCPKDDNESRSPAREVSIGDGDASKWFSREGHSFMGLSALQKQILPPDSTLDEVEMSCQTTKMPQLDWWTKLTHCALRSMRGLPDAISTACDIRGRLLRNGKPLFDICAITCVKRGP